MRLSAFLAAAAVLAMATSAQAVQLVVMSTNANTGVAGQKAFLIGIKVSSTDVAKGGANATIFAQNITFTGGANGPVNAAGSSNKPDVQTLQTAVIDNAGEFPPVAADFTTSGLNSIYHDSWWFNSGTAVLNGVVDASFNSGTVTTSNGGTFGPTAAVGTTGFLFTPSGSSGIVPANAGNGQTMQYSGIYGPNGSNTLQGSTLAPLFVNGYLTVPLVQIVATGDIQIPDITTPGGGIGTFISVGNVAYDLSGAPAGSSTPAVLDFGNNWIFPPDIIPEPSSIVLAGMGALGLLLAWRRRAK